MRTTITLSDDTFRTVTAIARDKRQTISLTVEELVRLGLAGKSALGLQTDPRTGFLTVSVGRPVTSEDVRSLDDEE